MLDKCPVRCPLSQKLWKAIPAPSVKALLSATQRVAGGPLCCSARSLPVRSFVPLQGIIGSSDYRRNWSPLAGFAHCWGSQWGMPRCSSTASLVAAQLGEAARWGPFSPHMAASQLGAAAVLKLAGEVAERGAFSPCMATSHTCWWRGSVAGDPPKRSVSGLFTPFPPLRYTTGFGYLQGF